jgi:TRAP-type uncharacterized transport system substrate-binding protein
MQFFRGGGTLVATWTVGAALAVAGMAIAYRFVEPAPPKTIRMATGDPEQAYHAFGRRYAERLAESGIVVELVSTAGSGENLSLLSDADSGVDLALVQGGIADKAAIEILETLGSVYLEPLWIFHRRTVSPASLTEFRGLKIASGPADSGSYHLASELLAANGLAANAITPMATSDSVTALESGAVDAVMLVTAPQSEAIRRLISNSDVVLFDTQRADAYARLNAYLTAVTLPRGVLDLEQDLPAVETRLVAPAANLVVRDGFHPALVDLLLVAARNIHGQASILNAAGDFPAPGYSRLPLNPDARRHYEFGAPFLMRHLPFWAATLVDRLKIMVLPLLGLLLPLMRTMPPIYRWRIRRRIYRWYEELRAVDPDIGKPESLHAITRRMKELDRIEGEVAHVTVPLSYADELYDLRRHIDLVRQKLRALLS